MERTLIPGPLAQRCSVDRDIDIQHDGFAVAHAPQTSLQGWSQIPGVLDLLAFQSVRLRDFVRSTSGSPR